MVKMININAIAEDYENKKMNEGNREIEKIRNIGIIAHIDAGKTTLTERILYYSGKIHKIGEVDEGTATMDWMIQEQERGITITSASTFFTWKNFKINLIDTPGHVDFTAEVERTLRVLDGLVVVFCAVEGIQSQSETVWRQADKYKIPRLVFVNKMDRVGADFFKIVRSIKENLNSTPVALQIPVVEEEKFIAIIDIVNQKFLKFIDSLDKSYIIETIPEEYKPICEENRKYLFEILAERDEKFFNLYTEDKEISTDLILTTLRNLTISKMIVPVYCGSALKNMGIQPLMDGITQFLPDPAYNGFIQGTSVDGKKIIRRNLSQNEKLAAIAFKISTDTYVDNLTYIRVYSGKIRTGSHVYNSNKDKKEKVVKILRMHANHREEVDVLQAGEIGALVGLKFTQTGDTICTEDERILFESIRFPQPVIYASIEPKTIEDSKLLIEGLKKLSLEDPTFKFSHNKETGQTIISGMGELQLEIIVDRLFREFHVSGKLSTPQVAYKETITESFEGEGMFNKQCSGKMQFACVRLRVKPNPKFEEPLFIKDIKDKNIPLEYLKIIEESIMENTNIGPLAGFPLIGIDISLIDLHYNSETLSEIAVRVATQNALQNAINGAKPILLEPISKLEIVTQKVYMGEIINDLNSREGKIISYQNLSGDTYTIIASAPLRKLFGYTTALRSISQGRAVCSMEFYNYEKVAEEVVKNILFI